jgi:hypothetical protein
MLRAGHGQYRTRVKTQATTTRRRHGYFTLFATDVETTDPNALSYTPGRKVRRLVNQREANGTERRCNNRHPKNRNPKVPPCRRITCFRLDGKGG